jgi:hypothetical protein
MKRIIFLGFFIFINFHSVFLFIPAFICYNIGVSVF